MKISIAMAVYNGEKYIAEQIVSIAEQTVKPDEIVVCDDCSTDNSELVIKKLCKEYALNLTYIRNDKNIGFNKNFEKAILHCTGDIIFLSDQDDVWNNRKIELMMNVFMQHKNIQLVFHDSEITDSRLETIYPSLWRYLGFDGSNQKLYHLLFLEHTNTIQGTAIAVRKKFARETIPFPNPFPKNLVYDYWLGLYGIYLGGYSR